MTAKEKHRLSRSSTTPNDVLVIMPMYQAAECRFWGKKAGRKLVLYF